MLSVGYTQGSLPSVSDVQLVYSPMQGSLQHLPVNPLSYGYSNWDRLIACRQSKDQLNRSRADVNGGVPSSSHFDDPVNLNDPLFFHPQHPRSVENFDLGEPGSPTMANGIPQRLYPAYQLPGLSYERRPDGSVAVAPRRSNPAPNKRAMDTAAPEGTAFPLPNKKRRLTDAS